MDPFLTPLAICIVALISAGALVSGQRNRGMTTARQAALDSALRVLKDPEKLKALASVFEGEGLRTEGGLLRVRAAYYALSPEAKRARRKVFERACESRDPDAVERVAAAFAACGATKAARDLRVHANAIRAGLVPPPREALGAAQGSAQPLGTPPTNYDPQGAGFAPHPDMAAAGAAGTGPEDFTGIGLNPNEAANMRDSLAAQRERAIQQIDFNPAQDYASAKLNEFTDPTALDGLADPQGAHANPNPMSGQPDIGCDGYAPGFGADPYAKDFVPGGMPQLAHLSGAAEGSDILSVRSDMGAEFGGRGGGGGGGGGGRGFERGPERGPERLGWGGSALEDIEPYPGESLEAFEARRAEWFRARALDGRFQGDTMGWDRSAHDAYRRARQSERRDEARFVPQPFPGDGGGLAPPPPPGYPPPPFDPRHRDRGHGRFRGDAFGLNLGHIVRDLAEGPVGIVADLARHPNESDDAWNRRRRHEEERRHRMGWRPPPPVGAEGGSNNAAVQAIRGRIAYLTAGLTSLHAQLAQGRENALSQSGTGVQALDDFGVRALHQQIRETEHAIAHAQAALDDALGNTSMGLPEHTDPAAGPVPMPPPAGDAVHGSNVIIAAQGRARAILEAMDPDVRASLLQVASVLQTRDDAERCAAQTSYTPDQIHAALFVLGRTLS